MIPVAGSAYTYAYATLGEIFAWIIGWDLILEYAHGRRDRRGRLVGLFRQPARQFRHHIPPRNGRARTGEVVKLADGTTATAIVNLPAVLIVVVADGAADGRHPGIGAGQQHHGRVQAVRRRRRSSSSAPFYVNRANWRPFIPPNTGTFGEFGWSGILRGAGVVFFAYIGFDAVSTAAQEAKTPQRDMPIGILGSLDHLHGPLCRWWRSC